MAFATPPNPVRPGCLPPATPPGQTDLAALIKLHEMGIIDKQELRERVLAYHRPPAQQAAPVQPPPPQASKRKRKGVQEEGSKVQKRFNKKQKKEPKKTRPGKPTTTVARIHKMVKDPTRQRFFAQCQDPASLLWQPSPAGKDVMVKLLFDKACLDPIDAVYRLYPSESHGVEHGDIKREVK